MRIKVFGNGMERIPNLAFRMMGLMFAIRDRLTTPWSILDEFGIKRGQTVVDYGCGTGSYLARASQLAGDEGKVIAVDVHELAIEAVSKRIEKQRLRNITAVLAGPNGTPLPDKCADVIYALDMFHMARDPKALLGELNRICKEEGVLFIDNGHQSREQAKAKIDASRAWEVTAENKRYMKCAPVGRALKNETFRDAV